MLHMGGGVSVPSEKRQWLEGAAHVCSCIGLSAEAQSKLSADINLLCLTALKISLLKGYLQGTWPGLVAAFDYPGAVFNEQLHDAPLRELPCSWAAPVSALSSTRCVLDCWCQPLLAFAALPQLAAAAALKHCGCAGTLFACSAAAPHKG
jgi:hypothetical protein